MHRRAFLAGAGILALDPLLPPIGPLSVGSLSRALADNPGDTLWHCHQALHMDFSFMQLMKYVG